jgi:hypothetical protein
MRASTLQVIVFAILAYAGGVGAVDLAAHEKTCAELGFKKRTPAFGECVLELDSRIVNSAKSSAVRLQAEAEQAGRDRAALEQKARQEAIAMKGDGTPDHDTCRNYGFTPQTPDYAQCRLKVDQFRRQSQAQEQEYKSRQQEYQSQLAAQQRAKESRQGEALLRLGLGMMGGSTRSAAPAPTAIPEPPLQRSSQQNIFLPGGRIMSCMGNGSVVDCR